MLKKNTCEEEIELSVPYNFTKNNTPLQFFLDILYLIFIKVNEYFREINENKYLC